MIELFINFKSSTELPEWNEVVLPDDYEFTETEENPEITSAGTYTLDVTVSLLEAKNAIAFRFINRENNSDIKQTAYARKIEYGIVKSGTIEIQKNSDIDVTFQFLAGNSELNYIANNEKKIWELDWGTENEITFELASRSINYPAYGVYENTPIPPFYFHTSWVQNYVCTPVMIGGKIYNNYILNENGLDVPSEITGIEDIIMQPYLLYYVNKLPELLGYTLKINVLNANNRAKKMFLTNSVDSLKYADAQPDLTITEFIDAIEKFFNVIFVVNSREKSISITNLNTSVRTKKTVKIENVLDNYERDLSQNADPLRYSFTKIAYKQLDSTYFKYQQLSSDVLAKCQIVEFPNLAALIDWIKVSHEFTNQMYIYRDLEKNNDYCFGIPSINFWCIEGNTANEYINLINKFSAVGISDDKILELNIVPAEMVGIKKSIKWYSVGGQEKNGDFGYQLPKCSNSYFINNESGFIDTVEKGIKSITRNSKFEVALITGKVKMLNAFWNMFSGKQTILYPFSHVDFYPEFGTFHVYESIFAELADWTTTYFMPAATETLRIKGLNGVAADYQQQSILDITKEYSFIVLDGLDVSANNIFEINNKNYIPITLERKKSRDQKTVLVKCYAML